MAPIYCLIIRLHGLVLVGHLGGLLISCLQLLFMCSGDVLCVWVSCMKGGDLVLSALDTSKAIVSASASSLKTFEDAIQVIAEEMCVCGGVGRAMI